MSFFFSEETIERIRERNDIVDVISDYLSLKRTGNSFKALCPFHNEKTPSFIVNQQKQIFHCFGCGTGGNVFGFLMKIENIEFPEAAKILAEKAGISVSYQKAEKSSGEKKEKEGLLKLLNEAADFYHRNLLYSDRNKHALDYLAKRKIDKNTIAKYKLGYADSRLKEDFIKKGFTLNNLVEAGLLLKTEREYCPRFRQRVIFPIFDIKNRTVGLGGRVIDDNLPKYINSPESKIYHKGDILYGLNWAKDHIRQNNKVFIVEGYLDLIRMQISGIENTVATLGTALTVGQIKQVKRFCDKIYFVYDPDTAGQAAALRGMQLGKEEGMEVKVVGLPYGRDPDTFLIENGKETFNNLAEKSIDFFDFLLFQSLKKYDTKTPLGKSKVIEELKDVILNCPNPIEKDSYIKNIADKLYLKESLVISALRELKGKKQYSKVLSKTNIFNIKEKESNVEQKLIQLLLKNPELIQEAKEKLLPEDLSDSICKNIYEEFLNSYSENKKIPISQILTHWFNDEKTQNYITKLACEEINYGKNEKQFLVDYIKKILLTKNQIRSRFLLSEINSAQEKKEEERLKKLLREYQDLKTGL